MSITASHSVAVSVAEILENNPESASAAGRTIEHNQFNKTTETLNSTSTPPATKVAASVVALSGGAKTLDLTAIEAANGISEDMSGLKLQILRMVNLGANTISIAPGASDGYDLFGADFKITLSSGQEVTLYGNDATPDVAGADKELDFAGTAAQTFQIIMVFG